MTADDWLRNRRRLLPKQNDHHSGYTWLSLSISRRARKANPRQASMGCGRACERVTGPQRPAPIPWTPGPGGSHRQPPTYVKGAAVGSRARRMEVPKSFWVFERPPGSATLTDRRNESPNPV
ncbi:hypothetical protein PHYSODRAFT_325571 [Phytophthora sojae]|uniref:Uncharacterized protein n=1 Tax=Phytophthora sojae (strain P6497) TaxID=1094619 RepID=G4YWV6_PHYSP|nr:hypothetical protein PHYSODRAFT_325571 [Phytophthora sojae]EGZ24454.1 hypothetical protein PHYSODRAFT_325571 [Phytophthora sojae]|eukprot:XP_009519742.1 hypothetical protein PHYSODRAFT_325571 [Phytophthora sojae]